MSLHLYLKFSKYSYLFISAKNEDKIIVITRDDVYDFPRRSRTEHSQNPSKTHIYPDEQPFNKITPEKSHYKNLNI